MSAHAGDERLGPYRLHERLGEGGMGVVYLASGPSGEQVAIKVLRQGIPAEATARSRLAREVDTMRRVQSRYVAEVLDADVAGSPPYIVTRYVAGRTLEDVVTADGPITGPALGRLATGLAAALVAVHDAGIVHRDLKPGNVMMVDGDPVVIDFGIAQAPDATRLTMTGMFMGTPGYLAPEIIEGRTSGPAADIHSFGATLAYAATGRPPFGTGQFEVIFYRIVHGQPELANMPTELLPLVLGALARDPARRPSAADLAQMCAGLSGAALVPGAAAAAGQSAAARAHPVTALAYPGIEPAVQGGPAFPSGLASPAIVPDRDGHAAMTAHDLLVRGVAAPAPAAWPQTRPIAAPGRDDFADLLPPVRYDQPANPAGVAQLAAPGSDLAVRFGDPNSVQPGEAGPAGRQVAAEPGQNGQLAAGTGPVPLRRFLVFATLAALVAVAVMLPLAGAVMALVVLVLLRSTDVTTAWLAKRRSSRGPRRGDPAAAATFYPWAVFRSVLRFVLISPLALLCGAVAAALAVLADGSSSLPKAGGYTVGAIVACYCLGPGSAACRRPLNKFYGSLTRTPPAAVLGTVGVVAVAAAVVAAAVTVAPGYWPDAHLGNQLQSTTFVHPGLGNLTGNMTEIGRKLVHWFQHG